jgi:hypothetical protein
MRASTLKTSLKQRLQAHKRARKRQILKSMHLIQLVLVLGLAFGLLVHEMKDINKKKRKRMDSTQQQQQITQKSSNTVSSSSVSFVGPQPSVPPPLYSYDNDKLKLMARAYPKWGESLLLSAAAAATAEMRDRSFAQDSSGESYRWCSLVSPQRSTEQSEQVGGLHFVPTFPTTTSVTTCTSITLTIAHRVGRRSIQQQERQRNHTTTASSPNATIAAAVATAPNSATATRTNTADADDAICSTHFYSHHGLPNNQHFSYRNKSSSFLWTIVQEPRTFAWNTFYDWNELVDPQHHHNNMNENNNKHEDNKNGIADPTLLLDHLQQSMNSQYNQIQNAIRGGNNNNNHPEPLRRRRRRQQRQLQATGRVALSSNAHTNENNLDDLYLAVQETVQQYDLIAVADRLAESLVVLKFVLNLDHGEILALSWKSSGPYYAQRRRKQQSQQQGGSSNTMCVRIPDPLPPPPLTSSLQVTSYLETTYLNPLVNVDNLLHVTASLSLDATIDSMPGGGRLGFERVLQEHLLWQTLVDEYCAPPRTQFPCSTTGVYQGDVAAAAVARNCFVVVDANEDDDDNDDEYYACGHACIAQLWQDSGGNQTRAMELVDA